MKIPPHIEHVDCPKCIGDQIANIVRYGGSSNAHCKRCGGESVIRADNLPTLKTQLGDGYKPPAR